VAPDGAAWFTEARAHKLGRVRGGVVKEFALPAA
jgi:streptogramin lyase